MIALMPLDYLLGVRNHLERQADELYIAELGVELGERLSGSFSRPDSCTASKHSDPMAWLRATPLYQALRACAESKAGLEGDKAGGAG